MTSSRKPTEGRRPAADAVVDVAAVQARVSARAGTDAHRRSCWRWSSALPDALLALWFKMIADGVQRARRCDSSASPQSRSACRRPATWFLRTVSTRVQRRFRDKITIALESHVARLQATITTIAHQERPEHLDRHRDAARSGVRARSHVHVGVLDGRLDSAAWRDDRRC